MSQQQVTTTNKRRLAALVFFTGAVFVSTCYFYSRVLSGIFIFDDYPNFYALRFIHSGGDAIRYILEGPGGTRWLAYASFLPHIEAWRNDNALPFKLVNLLLHTTNSLLLLFFLRHWLKQKTFVIAQPWPGLLALLIAVLWFAHPAHVNTVLYSVQRMTLLAGTAVLLGCYCHLRFFANRTEKISCYHWLVYSSILAAITAIGILGKETAILLPAFALLLLVYSKQLRLFRYWQIALTFASPYILLLGYLFLANRLGYGSRDFDMAERLMSQVVIVQEYLFKLLAPNRFSFALLYDGFEPVRSITDTRFLRAAFIWIAGVFLLWHFRRQVPLLTFGFCWFLLGHSLEAGIIPLELYFDHRNYIPSIGIMLAMVLGFYQLLTWTTRYRNKRLTGLLILTALLMTANLVRVSERETHIWQDRPGFVMAQLEKQPQSLRAHQGYVELLFNAGQYAQAINMIEKIHQHFGVYPSHIMHQALAACYLGADENIKHETIVSELPGMPFDRSSDDALQNLFEAARRDICPSLDLPMFRRYALALLDNPRHRRHYHNYAFLLMHSHIREQNLQEALQASLILAEHQRSQQYWFTQIRLAIATKNPELAEELLAAMQAFDAVNKVLYKHELDEFSRQIKALQKHHATDSENPP